MIRGIERVGYQRFEKQECGEKGRWVRNGGHLEDKASVLVEKAGRWIGTRCNVCERMAEKEVEKKAGLSEWNGARRWTGGLRGAVKKMATKKVKLTRARPGKKTRYGSALYTLVYVRNLWINGLDRSNNNGSYDFRGNRL